MKSRLADFGIITLVWTLVCLVNLGEPRLWDRDEPRNAGCAAEMLQRGDWIVPTFNEELRGHKPVLTYWAMRLSYLAFGVNEFSARLPSALSAYATMLLIYLVGTKLYDCKTGLLAGVALGSTLMFPVAARAATPDGLLVFTVTATFAVYVLGTDWDAPGKRFLSIGGAVGLYSAMALATLTKGPVGFVLPTAVIGMFLLLERRTIPVVASETTGTRARLLQFGRDLWSVWQPLHFLKTCLFMRPMLAVGVIALIATPWYIAVHNATAGEFTRQFFVEHNLERATNTMEGHDGGPLKYAFYPVALIVGSFPWSVFWLPMVVMLWRTASRDDLSSKSTRFLLCWLCVFLGAFTVAGTKLPSYITPTYPAWCLLIAHAVMSWVREREPLADIWPKLVFGSQIVVGAAVLVGFAVAAHILIGKNQWLAIGGLFPLAAGIMSLRYWLQNERQRAIVVQAIGNVGFAAFAMAIAPAVLDKNRPIEELLAAADVANRTVVVSGCLEPSWVFYAGKRLPEVGPTDGDQLDRYLSEDARVIVSEFHLERFTESVSQPIREVARIDGFFDDTCIVIEQDDQIASEEPSPVR